MEPPSNTTLSGPISTVGFGFTINKFLTVSLTQPKLFLIDRLTSKVLAVLYKCSGLRLRSIWPSPKFQLHSVATVSNPLNMDENITLLPKQTLGKSLLIIALGCE